MEKYREQLTEKYQSSLYGLYGFLIVLSGIMFIITLSVSIVLAVLSIGLGILFFILRKKQFVEFEYIFTNGDIDIDAVYESKSRKRLINFDMNDVIMMAPIGSEYLKGLPKGKKIIAYPKNTKEKVFVAVISKGGKVSEISFIPDEEMLAYCFRSNPKNVKKKD